MKTFETKFKEPLFKARLSKDFRWYLAAISIFTAVVFFAMLIKDGALIFEDIGFLLLILFGNFTFFLISCMLFSYKSNRYLIRKLSYDDRLLFVEYDEYMDTKELKYPLNEAKITLVQWYHTNSIYLKISTDESTIKQYRGTGWRADELREIFKALKEAQKNLEVESE